MQEVIERIIKETPGLKGREIAKKAGFNRKAVNAFLHNNKGIFTQDEEYCWSLAISVLELSNGWITDISFEESLSKTGCLFDNSSASVLVKIHFGCKIMLIATARLLALLNQLVFSGRNVTIDFTDSPKTKTFLNRGGFFDHLDKNVKVLPKRPKFSAAKKYKGNSNTLVEFGRIDPQHERENKELIDQLCNLFVQQSNDSYETVAFTIFSELIGNVTEHSKSPISGIAALQKYEGRRKHIQTIVSDSGVGIAKTLRPSLKSHYPNLFKLYKKKNIESDAGLVAIALSKGDISRYGSGRGLGFKSSRKQAMKFDAELTVRQENFYLKFQYSDGQLVNIEKDLSLPKIKGTHLCFDFFVDQM